MTPYLAVTSPEKRSGKTRLIEVLNLLVAGPLRSANASPAVLFRTIDAKGPTTLFLDEVDTVLKNGNSEMAEAVRGLLNAGFERGTPFSRMEGQGAAMKPRHFDVFCPKLIAGIGKVPETVADRAIDIRMKRKRPGEQPERFYRRQVVAAAVEPRARLAAWAAAQADALAEARPELPDELDDRAADGWEPLLAIAAAAGGDWPARARRAALALSGGPRGRRRVLRRPPARRRAGRLR